MRPKLSTFHAKAAIHRSPPSLPDRRPAGVVVQALRACEGPHRQYAQGGSPAYRARGRRSRDPSRMKHGRYKNWYPGYSVYRYQDYVTPRQQIGQDLPLCGTGVTVGSDQPTKDRGATRFPDHRDSCASIGIQRIVKIQYACQRREIRRRRADAAGAMSNYPIVRKIRTGRRARGKDAGTREIVRLASCWPK